ncbi:HET-domain-containing protein [Thozetella sp. PMI_491]|nr:HET-domain-containing protein [Thozetella sp. PMI_491]
MLCGDCRKHFGCDLQSVRAGYLALQADALGDLRKVFGPRPEVDAFELHHQTFARELERTDTAPCPWYPGDLSWLDPEFKEGEVDLEIWDDPRSGTSVAQTASEGCELCRRLSLMISQMPDIGDSSSIEVESWVDLYSVSLRPIRIRFLVKNAGEASLEREWLDFNFLWPREGRIPMETPHGNVSSDDSCLDFLQRSLNHCLASHSRCNRDSLSDWIPSRLLDVGSLDHTGLVYMRERHEVHGAPTPSQKYITLSHVWGSEQVLTLTRETFATLKQGVSLDDLPRVFREAVGLTRRLGVRYLWVDSLCILQDCVDDWQTESSSMDKIYRHGICNIAASSAANAQEALFWERDPGLGGPFPATWSWSGRQEDCQLFFDWFHLINNHCVLNKRGWVLQERLLSPRTMHFSGYPFWECRELVSCEASPSPLHPASHQWLARTHKLDPQDAPRTEKALVAIWNSVVCEYSRARLTRETDKLVALSGISRIVSGAIQSEFLAGIWKKDLLRSLLWQVRKAISGDDLETFRTYDDYVAPSWTWASIEGEVDPFWPSKKISQPLVEILLASVQAAGDDPFGQVTGGELHLKGILFKIPPIALIKESDQLQNEEFDAWAFGLDHCGIAYWEDQSFFLPLAISPDASEWDNLVVCGLIVQQAANFEDTGAYTRVGFAIVSEDGHIANSGWYCENWVPPPWHHSQQQLIVIV